MGSINGSYYPDTSASAALETELANMASAEDDRFSAITSSSAVNSYRPATSTALAALTGMSLGDLAIQTDTGVAYRYSGSVWVAWESDWIAHTPTLTNVTIGNGTLPCRYKYDVGLIRYRFAFVFGSTSSLAGVPVFTIPVNLIALTATRETYEGVAQFWDASAGARFIGVVASNGTAVDSLAILATGGISGATQNPTSTIPLGSAFAVGDAITANLTYRPA